MSTITLVKRPLGTENCEGCGKLIYRNLARLDGRPYHFGCLKKTKAKPTHYCLNCCNYLTPAGITKTYYNGIYTRTCGNCGSTDIKPLSQMKKKPRRIIFT